MKKEIENELRPTHSRPPFLRDLQLSDTNFPKWYSVDSFFPCGSIALVEPILNSDIPPRLFR